MALSGSLLACGLDFDLHGAHVKLPFLKMNSFRNPTEIQQKEPKYL
jgi:hypothetical protein